VTAGSCIWALDLKPTSSGHAGAEINYEHYTLANSHRSRRDPAHGRLGRRHGRWRSRVTNTEAELGSIAEFDYSHGVRARPLGPLFSDDGISLIIEAKRVNARGSAQCLYNS
jgi:hypothetical protein